MKKEKKGRKKGNNLNIKEPQTKKSVSKKDVESFDYPIFCFKHLSDRSYKDCTKPKFFIDYLKRLQKLSELGWEEIRKSDKHQFGIEKLPVKMIKPDLPSIVTPDVTKVDVFRANGDNHPFVGLVNGNVFQVFFIESRFGDVYDH